MKLIDFEFASREDYSKRQLGTSSHVSPQIIQNLEYDLNKNDIWSLGVLFFCLYTKNRPYNSPDKMKDPTYKCEWLKTIKEERWDEYWISIDVNYKKDINPLLLDKNGNIQEDFKDLIERMLSWDERKRDSLYYIITHPFFNEVRSRKRKICCKC